MAESNQQRKWVREEVVILVVEYFRTKNLSADDISETQQQISDFLRKREEILTGAPVSDVFRNYAGIHMQSGRIRCEYLKGFDNTYLYSGSYAIVGTTVVRTSYRLESEQQLEITSWIFEQLSRIEY